MEKVCLNCERDLPTSKQKYCCYECLQAFAKRRYKEANPDTFRGKTPATTGAISELRVAVDLLARGYDVFRALSPNAPCDLAVLREGKLIKIEVRTCHVSSTGKPYKTLSRKDNPNNIDHYARVLPDKIIYEPELE